MKSNYKEDNSQVSRLRDWSERKMEDFLSNDKSIGEKTGFVIMGLLVVVPILIIVFL